MDWKIREVESLIGEKLQEINSSLQVFKYEYSKYNDVFHTDDKFEVKSGEYWRARILGLQDEKADLEELLKIIQGMKLEEVRDLEALEDDYLENKFNSKYGI